MDKLAQKFAELADQYGPHVVDAAMAAARTEAYSTLMAAVVWLLAAAGLARAGRYLWRLECEDSLNDDIVRLFGAIAIVLASGCVLVALWSVIDPWTWTAMMHPEQWIAKRVLKL